MICIVHGYLLEGSGSNVWTRAIARALCRGGQQVHLVCQEPHPEIYDFITAADVHMPDGSVSRRFERGSPYAAACVMHQPKLGDTLPVYVSTPDRYEEFANVVPMVTLSDDAIEAYLARNVEVVKHVVEREGITAILANHAVLMSVVAERVSAATGVPFSIMPHGSAIEYVVKKDARFHALAASAFEQAARIFVHGHEMRQRVIETFPQASGLEQKTGTLSLGVDTGVFELIGRDRRADNIEALKAGLADRARGMLPALVAEQRTRVHADIDYEELLQLCCDMRGHTSKLPDAGLEDKLGRVDWENDDIMLFVGRLISSKGLQSIVAALPLILAARDRARLIITGHGPLRPVMETLLWALANGAHGLVRNIATWGCALEGGAATPFEELRLFFDDLETRGELHSYFETARRVLDQDRVIFTGYLTHAELRYLMPCCDVAIFPSVVAEAGPLVLLEALASGCFPIGTYFAGMAAHIDSVSAGLPGEHAALMRLSNDRSRTVADIIAKTKGALTLGGRHKQTLRQAVEAQYDWTAAARSLAAALPGLQA